MLLFFVLLLFLFLLYYPLLLFLLCFVGDGVVVDGDIVVGIESIEIR